MSAQKERWNSRLGVILAVAGSAVGLGNFLRFPGQAAQFGGGAFMLAYFISLLIIGLPICWAEWTMGRYGGQRGFNSSPGVFHAMSRSRYGKYLGVIGVVIPVVIYMYYVVIEAWCLGYAVNFALGRIAFTETAQAADFFNHFIGADADGSAIGFSLAQVGLYLGFAFLLNFVLIYRGVSRGIELFCTYAMPALVVLALITLVRVLTLGTPNAAEPQRNVNNGLGFMWNPHKVVVEQLVDGHWTPEREIIGAAPIAAARAEYDGPVDDPTRNVRVIGIWEQLQKPGLWLAAAGQIFFSLSVGFGVIITYSSYLRRQDDIVLSGLTATSANEFCEVALGGLITLPAGVAFLGLAGVAGQGTFGLGFNVLPMVFSQMPAGSLFGFLFFFLLFLAAVTSSLSMLQPGIAFLEEALGIGRKQSVAFLGLLTAFGSTFVVYFSKDTKALDTLDFWVGTFLIFILATIQIIFFSWTFGVDRGLASAHEGAAIRIPRIFRWIMKFLCPAFLLLIFTLWTLENLIGFKFGGGPAQVSGYVKDLFVTPNPVAWMAIGLILALGTFVGLLVARGAIYRGRVTEPPTEEQEP
jgi:SNF family Na+-dependent transporter